MNDKTKKLLGGILIAAAVVFGIVWMLINPAPEHIPDTNGLADHSLQQITEEDVIAMKMGSRGTPSMAEAGMEIAGIGISRGVQYFSNHFTGVYCLYDCQILRGSSINITLTDYQIYEGNFAFYIILDGKIIGQIEPDEFGRGEFFMENIEKTGELVYVVAGESADFSFVAPTEW